MSSIVAADIVPDPELPLVNGKSAKISDFAGSKLVLIHFASW